MNINGYRWTGGGATCAHEHLMPTFIAELELLLQQQHDHSDQKAFDLGCGNGSVAGQLANLGWTVHGVDPSTQGIESALQNVRNPHDFWCFACLSGLRIPQKVKYGY